MEASIPQTPQNCSLAGKPWFVEFLASKGFTKSNDNTFTNGKATIRMDGGHFFADPAVGDSTYRADFHHADPRTVTFMIEQILKMRSFRTDEELAQERAEKKSVDKALAGIALTIKDGPDTGGGVQLRRFLWSLYNMHHLVNLWRLTAELDHQRAAWVAEVFAGALSGLVKDADLKRALQTAGEMDRWESEHSEAKVLTELREAENAVAGLIREIPPSRTHTVLVSLLGHIAEAQGELREENPIPA